MKSWFQANFANGERQKSVGYVKMRIEVGESHQVQRRIHYGDLRMEIYGRENGMENPQIDVPEIFGPSYDHTAPELVLIKGRAGMGKTTLVRKILTDWSSSMLWNSKFDFIHWFELRNLNGLDGMSCVDLLQNHQKNPLINVHWNELYAHTLQHLENTLLIFDGLDEFRGFDKMEKALPERFSAKDQLPFHILLFNIMKGNILSGVHCIVTSRPRASGIDIVGRSSFDRVIELCGFSHEDVMEYVDRVCKDQLQLANDMKDFLNSNPNILSFCLVPVVCSFICDSLKKVLGRNEKLLLKDWMKSPTTNTQLFTLIMTFLTLDRHAEFKGQKLDEPLNVWSQVGNSLHNLIKLATWGLLEKPAKLVFNKEDIARCGIEITKEEIAFGILNSMESESDNWLLKTEETISFLHLLNQEILMSLGLVMWPWIEIEKIVTESSHGQYDMVFAFLIGFLSDPQLKGFVAKVYPQIPSGPEYIDRASKLLESLVIQGMGGSKEGRKLLVNLLNESQDPTLADVVYKVLVGHSEKLDMRDSSMTDIDCRGLAFLLQHSTRKPTEIE